MKVEMGPDVKGFCYVCLGQWYPNFFRLSPPWLPGEFLSPPLPQTHMRTQIIIHPISCYPNGEVAWHGKGEAFPLSLPSFAFVSLLPS